MNETTSSAPRLSGRAKFLVDFGPLLVFLVAYFAGTRLAPIVGGLIGRDLSVAPGEELYLAVGAFLPSFAVAFLYSVWKERRVAPMLLVSGVAVGVLGTLTLVLQNKTFFYMKPTIVYALFSVLLAGGLLGGRNLLKTLFDGALNMSEDAWRTLTKRYAVFFAALGAANEIAWRWLTRECDLGVDAVCAGEPIWVNLKVFGFTIVNIIFAGLQAPFLMKHAVTDDQTSE
ncbi:MAG: inner membrane-spanning protein YciB [Pseudomonadota bacterium]